jgi:hypothetical protein
MTTLPSAMTRAICSGTQLPAIELFTLHPDLNLDLI